MSQDLLTQFSPDPAPRSQFLMPSTVDGSNGTSTINEPASTPAPLTDWDHDGQPSILSYQMPVGYRISGRNYLLLGYDDNDFIPISNGAAQKSPDELDLAAAAASAGQQAAGPSVIVRAHPAVIPAGSGAGNDRLSASAATAAPSLRDTVIAPTGVVLGTPDLAGTSAAASPSGIVVLHSYQLSDELAALTWAQVQAVADNGQQIQIYRAVSGQWHFRVIDPVDAAPLSGVSPDLLTGAGHRAARIQAALTAGTIRPAETTVSTANGHVGGPRDDAPVHTPWVTVRIDSPSHKAPAQNGPSTGITLTMSGTCSGQYIWSTKVFVSTNGGPETEVAVSGGTWQATIDITTSGTYHLLARASADSEDGLQSASDVVDIIVTLDNPPAPPIMPTIAVLSPASTHTIYDPSGSSLVTVAGTVATNGGTDVETLQVTVDGGTPITVKVDQDNGGAWSTTVLLLTGGHDVLVTATNTAGVSAPAAVVTVTVALQQKIQRISRTLMLAETLTVNSYLTAVGAGRLVKVFSLLPGEEAVFKVSTYSKDSTTSKSASSILDSSSTEASADFEDTLSDSQTDKTNSQHTLDLNLEAKVSATWGFGNAEIKGSVGSHANDARESTVTSVRGAVAKHAAKAASNRSVTVNTEFSESVEEGKSEDVTRTLKNINVGRVLNYTFRQVTQEILVALAVVDAVLVDRTVDILLNEDGSQQRDDQNNLVVVTTVQEIPLSAVKQFAADNLLRELQDDFLKSLGSVFGNVLDHSSTMQSLVEEFTPSIDGTPAPSQSYLRVPPALHQDVQTPGGVTVSVPGIVLSTDVHTMPVDALMVDAVLGGGDALDEYSRGLQEVTIAERSAAVAREILAQNIVSSGNKDAAALWAQVFPPPVVPPVLVSAPAGNAVNSTATA